MTQNKTEILVGTAVLAIAVGFLIYAASVTGLTASTAGYPLSASFRSVDGIAVGTDVRMAGVKIGAVTDLTLNPETFRADTVFSVRDGVDIPDDSAISISSEGLLGGNFVEILPGGSPINLDPGGTIDDTQGSVSLINLLLKFVGGNTE